MARLINRSQMKILEAIRVQPQSNLRSLIEQTHLSPNAVSANINDFVKRGIVKEVRLEKKRVYLRQFALNMSSPLLLPLFSLIEEEKKSSFCQEHPRLTHIAQQIITAFPSLQAIVVYGSYAKRTETKDSDLDILLIGAVNKRERLREIFVTLDIEPSILIESTKDFERRKQNPLHQEIFRHHARLCDSGVFIRHMLENAAHKH